MPIGLSRIMIRLTVASVPQPSVGRRHWASSMDAVPWERHKPSEVADLVVPSVADEDRSSTRSVYSYRTSVVDWPHRTDFPLRRVPSSVVDQVAGAYQLALATRQPSDAFRAYPCQDLVAALVLHSTSCVVVPSEILGVEVVASDSDTWSSFFDN